MTKPILSDAQIKRRKKIQGNISIAGGSLGLTALALRGGAAAKGTGRVGQTVQRLTKITPNAARAEKLKDASGAITTAGAGLGGVGAFNFASYTKAEARKKQPVVQQTVRKGFDMLDFGQTGEIGVSEVSKAGIPRPKIPGAGSMIPMAQKTRVAPNPLSNVKPMAMPKPLGPANAAAKPTFGQATSTYRQPSPGAPTGKTMPGAQPGRHRAGGGMLSRLSTPQKVGAGAAGAGLAGIGGGAAFGQRRKQVQKGFNPLSTSKVTRLAQYTADAGRTAGSNAGKQRTHEAMARVARRSGLPSANQAHNARVAHYNAKRGQMNDYVNGTVSDVTAGAKKLRNASLAAGGVGGLAVGGAAGYSAGRKKGQVRKDWMNISEHERRARDSRRTANRAKEVAGWGGAAVIGAAALGAGRGRDVLGEAGRVARTVQGTAKLHANPKIPTEVKAFSRKNLGRTVKNNGFGATALGGAGVLAGGGGVAAGARLNEKRHDRAIAAQRRHRSIAKAYDPERNRQRRMDHYATGAAAGAGALGGAAAADTAFGVNHARKGRAFAKLTTKAGKPSGAGALKALSEYKSAGKHLGRAGVLGAGAVGAGIASDRIRNYKRGKGRTYGQLRMISN